MKDESAAVGPSAFTSSFRLHPSSFSSRPHAGNRRPARGAESVRADSHLPNDVPVALDQKLSARGAVSVLPASDSSRKVPRVDELQPRRAPYLARANQLLRRSVRVLRHLVVLVERRHVPRYVCRDRRDELGGAAQFFLRVVEARNDERHYLLP